MSDLPKKFPTDCDDEVVIDYTNWRGERAERKVLPVSIRFGRSRWHDEPQWLLLAYDRDRAQEREFAMAQIHSWRKADFTPSGGQGAGA